MTLKVNLIAAVVVAGPVEEVVEADLVERGGGGISRDVAADAALFAVGPNDHGHFCTYMMSLPREETLFLIFSSSEFSTVNTAMMAKIPMVIPRRVRNVRSLFATTELYANKKLSLRSFINKITSKNYL
jgi:hypothetical protein